MDKFNFPTENGQNPAGQKWARFVQSSLNAVVAEVNRADGIARRARDSTTRALAKVGDQIVKLTKTQTDLVQAQADLAKAQKDLADTQKQTADTVTYLNGLKITSLSVGDSYNTGDVPGDSTRRWSSGGLNCKVTTRAPTGRLLVTYGCGQVTIRSGNGTFIAYVRIVITGSSGYSQVAGESTKIFVQGGQFMGIPVSSERTIEDVPKNETLTVSVEFGSWSTGVDPKGNADFAVPYVRAQVIPA